MYLLRKLLASAVLVYLHSTPEVQGLLITLLYFAYWVYLFVRNPFRNAHLKVFVIFVESEMCLLHIIYFFVIATGMDGDTASEVALTKWVAYVVILQMLTYLVFAFLFSVEALRGIYKTYS